MKRSFLDSVLRGAEALAARDPVGTLPDPDLIRRFAVGRDPVAFAVLVRRHGPLVWGVCRNLLPADADAEDAFQATFLALVRSAATIRRTEALGGWLHGVAYRVALKARRAAGRRKKREITAAVPETSSPVPDAAWDELQAAVHEEVCQLPDKLRLPFVLCGLQGRPQKEAAEVLGWKIGTVSGRLSEARRRLLDRLARRGVPAGVAVGAAVLGGVAGRAAVPTSIGAKVMSLVGSPASVSETVLSLARGVTPMYLTRSKLLAAGLVLAGILTTSVGLLSRADAQPPPASSYDDAIRKYYDALRTHPASKDKWEYRFVPVDKPLTPADLQKVLAGADQEGWTYCGSQDLIHLKTDKATPHMVFKRRTTGGVAESTPGPRDAAAAALAELKAKNAANPGRIAEYEEAFRKQAEAERAARDEAAHAREVEARSRADLEKVIRETARQADAAKAAAITEKALHEQEAARRKQLEAMKAQYENLINQLQAELKAKAATPAKRPNPSNTKPEPQASNPFETVRDKPETLMIPLKHVDATQTAGTLGKLFPAIRVAANEASNSVALTGPATAIADARGLLEKVIDVPQSGSGKKAEYLTLQLKKASAEELARVMEELFGGKGPRFVAMKSGNMLLVYGTPADLEDVKKLAVELDERGGPAK